jgi:hypothetical protein
VVKRGREEWTSTNLHPFRYAIIRSVPDNRNSRAKRRACQCRLRSFRRAFDVIGAPDDTLLFAEFIED